MQLRIKRESSKRGGVSETVGTGFSNVQHTKKYGVTLTQRLIYCTIWRKVVATLDALII